MSITIELPSESEQALNDIASRTGRSLNELVGEAIAAFVSKKKTFGERLKESGAAGMWRDRDDLPDFEELRASMDRNLWNET